MKFRAVIAMLSLLLTGAGIASAQELFPFAQPASNMPSETFGIVGGWTGFRHHDRFGSITEFEMMYGVNADLMVHASAYFSDLYNSTYRFEDLYFYTKYRFFTDDDKHEHFRMALYAEASLGRTSNTTPEVNLKGENVGVGAGIIATQLLHRFAGSVTLGVQRAMPDSGFYYQTGLKDMMSFNGTLSAGYLLLPVTYTGYDDVNVNLYTELMGKYLRYATPWYPSLDATMLDIGFGLQFIFNSRTRVDLTMKQQLNTSIVRMTDRTFGVRVEHNFF